jgi:O-antigen/teichoic acid export membrane protein
MKIIHAGAIYAAGNLASAAIPFALLPLLTRVLTTAEFGHVVAFSLLVAMCTPFAGLGIHGAIGVAWFNRSREELPDFVGAAIVVGIASTLFTALCVAMILTAAPLLAPGFSTLWGTLAALTAGASILLQGRLALWQSQQRPLANAVLQFVASALNVGLSLVGVLILGLGAEGRNGGIALSACLMALTAIALLVWSNQARWSLRRDHVKALLLFGVPLIPHGLSGVLIGTADRWIVSGRLGAEALGLYGAGAQLGLVMAVLADAFVKAYCPWLYARLASTDPQDKYRVVGAIYISIPVFLVVAAVLGFALYLTSNLLLGPQYRAATVVLPWFMLGGAFTGIYYCTTNLFFFSGRTSLLALATTASAGAGMLLIWMLARALGIEGAAMGYAATQGLLALLVNIIAWRNFDFPWGEVGKSLKVWWHTSFVIEAG